MQPRFLVHLTGPAGGRRERQEHERRTRVGGRAKDTLERGPVMVHFRRQEGSWRTGLEAARLLRVSHPRTQRTVGGDLPLLPAFSLRSLWVWGCVLQWHSSEC